MPPPFHVECQPPLLLPDIPLRHRRNLDYAIHLRKVLAHPPLRLFHLHLLHNLLDLPYSSSSDRPTPACAFWAKVVGETHFTLIGSHGSITPASSISSNFPSRYLKTSRHSVSPSSSPPLLPAPPSPTDNANTSANSSTNATTFCLSSSSKSSPMHTCPTTIATPRASANGSVVLVNTDSPSNHEHIHRLVHLHYLALLFHQTHRYVNHPLISLGSPR
ncbi:hypothetical protein DFP72DRAFT_1065167 [Ephemerocybe angulata]|uniref:Uncharacterized protein n=1 Tax=Ephemerocybe angulata TaxID=980116 RepID=A0A8H6M6S5_9AGAR|nr:hypothetical protein DFP72DRAFT_1065167 [Tulosesus angulatus]